MAYTTSDLTVFGHSYAAAGATSGATSDANTWVKLLQSSIGNPTLDRPAYQNSAVRYNGSAPSTAGFAPDGVTPGKNTTWWIQNQAAYTKSGTQHPGTVAFFNGVNDLTFNPVAVPPAITGKEMAAAIAWMRCKWHFQDSHASISYGGTWTSNAYTAINSGTTVRGAATISSILIDLTNSFPSGFPGGGMNFGFLGVDNASGQGTGGIYDIYVDFVLFGTFDMRGGSNATGGGLPARLVAHLPWVPRGATSVLIQPTTITTTGYFDWYGVEGGSPPKILVFGQPRLTATGLVNHGGAYTNTDVDNLNAALLSATQLFPGNEVVFASTSVMDANASYFAADQVHPNNTGHSTISGLGLAALEKTKYDYRRVLVNGQLLSKSVKIHSGGSFVQKSKTVF